MMGGGGGGSTITPFLIPLAVHIISGRQVGTYMQGASHSFPTNPTWLQWGSNPQSLYNQTDTLPPYHATTPISVYIDLI